MHQPGLRLVGEVLEQRRRSPRPRRRSRRARSGARPSPCAAAVVARLAGEQAVQLGQRLGGLAARGAAPAPATGGPGAAAARAPGSAPAALRRRPRSPRAGQHLGHQVRRRPGSAGVGAAASSRSAVLGVASSRPSASASARAGAGAGRGRPRRACGRRRLCARGEVAGDKADVAQQPPGRAERAGSAASARSSGGDRVAAAALAPAAALPRRAAAAASRAAASLAIGAVSCRSDLRRRRPQRKSAERLGRSAQVGGTAGGAAQNFTCTPA